MNAWAGKKAIELDVWEDMGHCRSGGGWLARVKEMVKIDTVQVRGDGAGNLVPGRQKGIDLRIQGTTCYYDAVSH